MKNTLLSLIISVSTIGMLLIGCSSGIPGEIAGSSGGGRAEYPPQIYGTISAIQSGNPSYATLQDVSEIAERNGKSIKRDSMTIKLPEGNWLEPGHWQSKGDTLDLFIGEEILDINHETSITGASRNDFQGIVNSIQNDELVINKVYWNNTTTSSTLVTLSEEQVHINLKPYTKILWEGINQVSVTSLKNGEPVYLVLEGPNTYLIARQLTVFPDLASAGWKIKN